MCLLIGLAWKFASHEWSPVFAFNLLWTSTLANLLCQLFIKYECKQTNPLGSNWKVFACFIELCLLSIFLMLVYSVLLRFWGSSLEHFFFPLLLSALQFENTRESIEELWSKKSIFFSLCPKKLSYGFHANMQSELPCAFSHSKHWQRIQGLCTWPCFPDCCHEMLE